MDLLDALEAALFDDRSVWKASQQGRGSAGGPRKKKD